MVQILIPSHYKKQIRGIKLDITPEFIASVLSSSSGAEETLYCNLDNRLYNVNFHDLLNGPSGFTKINYLQYTYKPSTPKK